MSEHQEASSSSESFIDVFFSVLDMVFDPHSMNEEPIVIGLSDVDDESMEVLKNGLNDIIYTIDNCPPHLLTTMLHEVVSELRPLVRREDPITFVNDRETMLKRRFDQLDNHVDNDSDILSKKKKKTLYECASCKVLKSSDCFYLTITTSLSCNSCRWRTQFNRSSDPVSCVNKL